MGETMNYNLCINTLIKNKKYHGLSKTSQTLMDEHSKTIKLE